MRADATGAQWTKDKQLMYVRWARTQILPRLEQNTPNTVTSAPLDLYLRDLVERSFEGLEKAVLHDRAVLRRFLDNGQSETDHAKALPLYNYTD